MLKVGEITDFIELEVDSDELLIQPFASAQRIDTLAVNDQIKFFGEYEWNDKDGVIHWTHHDPEKIHVNDWLFHNSMIYQ
ncbi:conserved hypothetical protein [Nitrosomonas mobilis]|uniref:DUF3465 domain-containing protein n=1 Tax=Nitrosomonas mobilis TaxID=51642 RepID=A0A1G5SDP4_9PROT|nr:conserved hypothetical protein [Nitrosomonas mobilis]